MHRGGNRVAALVLASGSAIACAQLAPQSVEFNGQWYTIHKDRVAGVEFTTFHDGQRWFTMDQLREHVAAQSPRILTVDAQQLIASTPATEAVKLIVVLRDQPGAPISREVWARVTPEKNELTRQIQAITREAFAGGDAPVGPLPQDRREARRAISRVLDDLDRDARLEIFQRVAAASAPTQNELAAEVARLGGRTLHRISSVNMLAIEIPAGAVEALARSPLVAQIDIDHAISHELANSRLALGVDTSFWANGITGGVHDAGILDTGVQQNHPALNSFTYISNIGATDSGGHGTLMAGITASTDANNRGMAFGIDKIVVAMASGTISISMTNMDFIAGTGEVENTNYSFGNGTANSSDYTPTDQFFDGVVNTHRYMVSKSTGNGGFGSGNPTITHPAPAFNLMACASINDFNTPTRTDDRISSFSSRGPTVGGRKKPDITAPGDGITSTTRTLGFGGCSGTSCSAPHVGASIILLYDMGVTDVMAGKAVLLNTTDAMDDRGTSSTGDDVYVDGSLWNRRYGWGYMNLTRAYANGLNYVIDTVPDSPEHEDFRLYTGPMQQFDKATLVWERHVAYNGGTFPTQIEMLSDLDLFLYRAADNTSLASSTSAIDNVEQLHSPSNESQVVIKVEASGTFDPSIEEERFAIATPAGFSPATGPEFDGDWTHPAVVGPGEEFEVRVDVMNAGDLTAHGVRVTFAGLEVVSGPNPAVLGAIAEGASQPAVWTVRAPGAVGLHQFSVSITSNSYGEAFAGESQSSIEVGSACYADCDPSTGPGVLDIFDFICFGNRFDQGDPYACDCDMTTGPGVCDVFDFLCFNNAFVAGCP